MSNLYITVEQLQLAAIANEADGTDVWNLFAEGVSRLFDRECLVSDGFFSVAEAGVSLRSYRANGTRYLELFPYIANSITIIDVNGTDLFKTLAADRTYQEKEHFLVFDSLIAENTKIDVSARYGFSAIPADIQMACIEQALFQWRKKDLAFAELSGVSAAAVNAEFSPTFSAVTKRYRDLYSANQYFA